jgi:hypothetical protein
MSGTHSLLRPSMAAIRTRFALQILPSVFMTIAIAEWTCAVVGTAKIQTMVITFAWAAVTGHQLVTSRRTEQKKKFGWSVDLVLSVLGGQILWMVLPWLQFKQPHAWYSEALAIPPTLVAAGAILAIGWPLHLFVVPAQNRALPTGHSEFDALVLYGSFFLLSGNLVFAVSAYAAVVTFLARGVRWNNATQNWRVHPSVVICPIKF